MYGNILGSILIFATILRLLVIKRVKISGKLLLASSASLIGIGVLAGYYGGIAFALMGLGVQMTVLFVPGYWSYWGGFLLGGIGFNLLLDYLATSGKDQWESQRLVDSVLVIPRVETDIYEACLYVVHMGIYGFLMGLMFLMIYKTATKSTKNTVSN